MQVSQASRPAVTTTSTSQSNQVAVRRHPAPLPSVPSTGLHCDIQCCTPTQAIPQHQQSQPGYRALVEHES